jgi:hypothetical protein
MDWYRDGSFPTRYHCKPHSDRHHRYSCRANAKSRTSIGTITTSSSLPTTQTHVQVERAPEPGQYRQPASSSLPSIPPLLFAPLGTTKQKTATVSPSDPKYHSHPPPTSRSPDPVSTHRRSPPPARTITSASQTTPRATIGGCDGHDGRSNGGGKHPSQKGRVYLQGLRKKK